MVERKKNEGTLFLIVAISLVIFMGYYSFRFGFNQVAHSGGTVLTPIILFFSTLIFTFQSYKQRKRNYFIGLLLVNAGFFAFILLPMFLL